MIIAVDNLNNEYEYTYAKTEYGYLFTVAAASVPAGLEYLEIRDGALCARTGEAGYYVISNVYGNGSFLCRFGAKDEASINPRQNKMSFFGVKTPRVCYTLIAEGMKEEFRLNLGLKDGGYYIYPRFYLNGLEPYEDITLKYFAMPENARWPDMARLYRKYRLEGGRCEPLKNRAAANENLRYAISSPEIRIRMGWKPAPAEILEQTEQNEPEMHAACTFRRVRDIVDELKRQGVKKAQLCLVGWNKSGHDGRWPQIFPVEEKLGGEKELLSLIKYAKENGYKIVCHTNSTDSYTVADCFDINDAKKNPDGTVKCGEYAWSGGRNYALCPKRALAIAQKMLPRVAALGFEGLHYVDVLSTTFFTNCHDKNHPANAKETAHCYNEIGRLCRALFGGFSSEGVNDFMCDTLDYGFYSERGDFTAKPEKILDEKIPLWQVVYHGIILSNASTDTVNYPVKCPMLRVAAMEYGSRPSFYFYSKFQTDSEADWLGREDLLCTTDEQLRLSVAKIKEAADEYEKTMYLQYEFMEDRVKVADGVYDILYSDGSVMRADYNTDTVRLTKPGADGKEIEIELNNPKERASNADIEQEGTNRE